MKHTLLLIATLITPWLLLWGVAGFIAWDWNAGEWAQESRFALVFFGLVSTYLLWPK